MNDTEGLIRRIQKLLALSDSPNENEAQAAAAKVQELLAANNLEMAEITATQTKAGAAPSATPRTKEHLQSSAMYSYQRDLMRSIARNNFCYYAVSERTKEDKRARWGTRKVKTHTLIGSHLNVTVATLLYEYLVQTMDRMLPWQGMEKRGKDALLWLAGCSDRLQDRLDALRTAQEIQQRQRAEEAGPAGNALVLLADLHGTEADLNDDFRFNYPPGTMAQRRRDREARDAAAKALWEAELKEALLRPAPEPKPETPSEQRKREARDERWRQQYERRQEKLRAKYFSSAYIMGNQAGGDIGLDPQVAHKPTSTLTQE